MTKELDEQLCQKYPEIFRDRHAPMNQTAMCWGFACGDGWFALIDTLCASLMHSVKRARDGYESRLHTRQRIETGSVTADQKGFDFLKNYSSDEAIAAAKLEWEQEHANIPVAVQVKEKFGGLRFYANGVTDAQDTMIQFAESMSYRICETCGTTTNVQLYTDGWHRTRCLSCAKTEGLNTEIDKDLWGV